MKHFNSLMLRATSMLALFAAVAVTFWAARAVYSTAALNSPASSSAQMSDAAATEVRVHVIARGGRYVGDDIGGALVTVRDAHTGEFLASGLTRGGSGVPDLMTLERARTTPLPTESASVFTTTLRLAEPRLVEIEAVGPPAAQGAENRVTSTEWILPQTFAPEGNRFTLEIAGLNVDVLSPPTHFLPQRKPPMTIPVRANVTMMCGCPISPMTDWKPEDFRVVMVVKRPDGKQDVADLKFDANAPDGAPSQFVTEYEATLPGIYEATVMAHQKGFGNSGSDRVTWILR